MSLSDRIKNKGILSKGRRKGPLWEGPESDTEQGGITFSLLSRFLVCRERFRLHAIEGLRTNEGFNHRLEYGNIWHAAEEAYARDRNHSLKEDAPWFLAINDYCDNLVKQYPLQREVIEHWFAMAARQFPVYINHWMRNPDVKGRKPLFQEYKFCVPITLSSGRTVYLRGKFDSGDYITGVPTPGNYIQENKTKSQINSYRIERQLRFDLQTMMYSVAFCALQKLMRSGGDKFGPGIAFKEVIDKPFVGVRYNVIRRSSHKTSESMLKKLTEDMQAGRHQEWFARWLVPISQIDMARFRKECLDPILEQLCEWYEWVSPCPQDGDSDQLWNNPFGSRNTGAWIHWRHPYGVYNVLDEGGASDLDECLESGSHTGLIKSDNLFPELS